MVTQTSSTPNSQQQQQPYLRLATIDDLDKIVDSGFRPFLHDPVLNYFGNVKKMLEPDVDTKACTSRLSFFQFLFKAGFLVGGRITVMVDPEKRDSNQGDKIIACALWLPPNSRLAIWKVPTMIKAGVIPVLKRWGLTGLLRIAFEYQAICESSMHKLFKRKGIKRSPDGAWYLQMIFTDPEYQGNGMMSKLVREAFAHSPASVFILEATTSKSRDQYAHLGFELSTPIKFGGGKADGSGVAASGADATGLEIWAMAKCPLEENNKK